MTPTRTPRDVRRGKFVAAGRVCSPDFTTAHTQHPHMNTTPTHTRRDVLKTAGLAILASGLPASAQPPSKKKRVIVVGGGIGGLSCAYELMEHGHEVTLLEASRRTGGHVKTIRDPLPDGLYADVGAEHFSKPGYKDYRRYVEKFDLPVLPWKRRHNMLREIDGKWFTEAQLADPKVLREFGLNQREIDYIGEHTWPELQMMYLDPYIAKFKDEYQPLGIGLDHLDHELLGDVLARDGASEAAIRFCKGGKSSKGRAPRETDTSALYKIWHAAISRLRGLPVFKRDVFHLEGGNQILPDKFAELLGERVRKNCPVTAIEHGDSGATVHFSENEKSRQLSADYLVLAVPPILVATLNIAPAWPERKAFALEHTRMSMQSRILIQTRTAFWKDDLGTINLDAEEPRLRVLWQTAEEVPGERRVIMSSGEPTQTPEETIAAFRKLYPGQARDTIEQCIVHQWWKEEPTAFSCERQSFPFGQMAKMWPALLEPVGRVHFVGAAYDCTPHGQDAATTSANRAANAIHAT